MMILRIGKDPQPGHMKNFVKTSSDSGGVHINSGIPNHAFYLAPNGDWWICMGKGGKDMVCYPKR